MHKIIIPLVCTIYTLGPLDITSWSSLTKKKREREGVSGEDNERERERAKEGHVGRSVRSNLGRYAHF